MAESFFNSLKKERIRKRIYKTRDMARADVFDYIEVFYNRTRRHSHLSGVSPEAFERLVMRPRNVYWSRGSPRNTAPFSPPIKDQILRWGKKWGKNLDHHKFCRQKKSSHR